MCLNGFATRLAPAFLHGSVMELSLRDVRAFTGLIRPTLGACLVDISFCMSGSVTSIETDAGQLNPYLAGLKLVSADA